MRLLIRRKFDAAHRLPDYKGPCANLHGHTWRVDLEIKGEVNPATGMLVDFKELKALVDSILPDHRCLNDVLPDIVPTAENLAQYFFARFDLAFVLRKWGVEVVSVAVWESDDACAIYP